MSLFRHSERIKAALEVIFDWFGLVGTGRKTLWVARVQ
jgi:hypothetical protein